MMHLSTQTESQLLMEFYSINSPKTKKETTEQAEEWHIYTKHEMKTRKIFVITRGAK